MTQMPPLALRYDGETLIPLTQRFAKVLDHHLAVDETIILAPHEDRSANSHRHFFASVHDAWLNLPEKYAGEFPTSEHLRKYALIKSGFYDERSFAASSKAEAVRLAAFVKPIDTFAIVTVHECTVRVFTAKSQSQKAMGRAEFQKSKEAVLGILAGMIEVEPAALSANAAA